MIAINIPLQLLLGLGFLALTLIIFTFPGLAFLKLLKFDPESLIEKYTLSTTFGFASFALIAYILAALNLRFLMWAFPIVGIFYLLNLIRLRRTNLNIDIPKNLLVLFLLVLITGMVGQIAVNAPSGFYYDDGIYFYSSHGHDGIWHLALMEEMQRNVFPFQNPEYSGHRLQNYHFFVDLLMSEITRLFPFSNLDVYFRLIPTFFSLLLGLAGFILVRAWSSSNLAGIWSMIFIYFAGSFGYLLTIPKNHNLSGETIFWVSQTQSVIGNPPHMAAFIILSVFLFCLLKYLKIRSLSLFLICAFLGGVIIEFKVYAGTIILAGLFTIVIWEVIQKRSLQVLKLFTVTLVISAAIYLPNSINSQEFLLFEPWWYIRTMVVAPDRLDWLDLELRRQTYISENNLKRVIQVEATAFLIFLFGNLGMRFLGFWTIYRSFKDNIFSDPFKLFFLSITAISFLVPLLFLQKGVAWNTIQFMQYFLLLFGFLASIATADLLTKIRFRYLKVILVILILILAVPTQLGLLLQFYANKPLSKVTYEELNALSFLKNSSNADDIILTAPFNKYEADKFYPPIPIYSWYDTGYVSAFSGRRTLLSDEEQVTIMGYDKDKLSNERKKIFETEDPVLVTEFLKTYDVDYIYLVYGQKFVVPVEELPIDMIYSSENVKLYEKI